MLRRMFPVHELQVVGLKLVTISDSRVSACLCRPGAPVLLSQNCLLQVTHPGFAEVVHHLIIAPVTDVNSRPGPASEVILLCCSASCCVTDSIHYRHLGQNSSAGLVPAQVDGRCLLQLDFELLDLILHPRLRSTLDSTCRLVLAVDLSLLHAAAVLEHVTKHCGHVGSDEE